MSSKNAYSKKIQAQLDEWDADIQKLQARADRAEANAQLEIRKQVKTLKRKRQEAGDKLAELKAAGDDAWEDFKDGLEAAKDSLGSALKSATSRFK